MRFRFGDCVLDPEARQLWRGGQLVTLPPRGLQLLLLLMERRPRALSHAHLRDAIWPNTLVGYTSLSQLVTLLRRALGDDTRPARIIRTIPRFGYVFAADVAEEVGPGEARFAGVFVAAGREYPIPVGESLVGRGEECVLRLESRQVSRVHARVVATDDRVTIEDAGSKNGTWIHGKRLEGPVDLTADDEVSLGTFRMVFRSAGAGSSARPE